jgi:hypothetical protein
MLHRIEEQRPAVKLAAVSYLAAWEMRDTAKDLEESRKHLDRLRASIDALLLDMWSLRDGH